MSLQPANSTTDAVVIKTGVTKTTCPYCGVGCGVLIEKTSDKVEVKGDPDHPSNFGRLCSKGSALGETVSLEGRLLEPRIHGKAASWNEALDMVASRFSATIAEHGPDSVAFYVSGQLLTEDYYVINKLAKGFVGTANIDTNSRLCMASSVAGHKRAFGSDTVPGCYEDLEQADLIVLVGSNAAWCHPVLFQRMMAAKEKNPDIRVVVIDPRRTQTCEGADCRCALVPTPFCSMVCCPISILLVSAIKPLWRSIPPALMQHWQPPAYSISLKLPAHAVCRKDRCSCSSIGLAKPAKW